MIGSGIGGQNAILQTSSGTNVVGLRSSKSNQQNTLFTLSSNSNKTQDKEFLAIQAKELEERNKKVWKPWWQMYLGKCEEFMTAAKKGDYETVARLINVDYAADLAVNVNY